MLAPCLMPPYPGLTTSRSVPMLAIGIIFGFIAVIGIFNVAEFGRLD